jgi:hypothetical protein
MRGLIETVLRDGSRGDLPAVAAHVDATWTDQKSDSYAQRPYLEVRGEYLYAVHPVYDDAPREAYLRVTKAQLRAIARDIEIAPKGVHLPVVSVRERHVEISGDDPRAAEAATIEGAEPTQSRRVYLSEDGYESALSLPGARVLFAGGPVEIPEPGTGWRVPVTAWRAPRAQAVAAAVHGPDEG